MIRAILCAILCALTIVVALSTAAVQSQNRDRGIALDGIKRECDMLEAVNGDRCQRILAQDWKPIPVEGDPSTGPAKSSPEPTKDSKGKDGKDARGRRSPTTPLLASSEGRPKP